MARARKTSGFTLAELLVSVLLMTLVLTAAYTAFSSSIRLWKLGEANLQTYQDARTGMGIMARELQNFVPGAAHMFEGDDSEFSFYAVTPPMHLADGSSARVLWIRYRLRTDANHEGRTLVREERVVEEPLPTAAPDDEDPGEVRVKLGTRRSFDLAYGVRDFTIRYYWLPPEDIRTAADATTAGQPPEAAEFTIAEEIREGDGMPRAIALELTLTDPNADDNETVFKTFVAPGGPTTELEEAILGEPVVLLP